MKKLLSLALFLVAMISSPALGQHAEEAKEDFITPHILDSHHIEVPWPSFEHGFLVKEVELPHLPPVHIGPYVIDLSPTKHVVMLLLASTILCLVLILAARSQARSAAQGRPPKGFANAIEALVLYMRNEVILPNVGHHGEQFVPYLLSLFFFILACNLLGLFPYMSTATGNIAVTLTLAITAFVMIEIAGMRALGKGYIGTIVYWPHDMPLAMRIPMTFVMTPVEILGKFTKPFAFTMRLMANMTAGHVVVLPFFGTILSIGPYWIRPVPAGMGGINMFLELFVSFLQAFIFCLLTSVFIGLIRESH